MNVALRLFVRAQDRRIPDCTLQVSGVPPHPRNFPK
jgi:hypothetical protein